MGLMLTYYSQKGKLNHGEVDHMPDMRTTDLKFRSVLLAWTLLSCLPNLRKVCTRYTRCFQVEVEMCIVAHK